MATHSSILAWRIPWTEEPSGLQSMESQSRQDWVTNTLTFIEMKGKTSTKEISGVLFEHLGAADVGIPGEWRF